MVTFDTEGVEFYEGTEGYRNILLVLFSAFPYFRAFCVKRNLQKSPFDTEGVEFYEGTEGYRKHYSFFSVPSLTSGPSVSKGLFLGGTFDTPYRHPIRRLAVG